MLSDPGLYAHFPWCVRKCPYCDFNSHPVKGDVDYAAYVDALLSDHAAQRPDCQFSTVFLGGGTPSLCPPQQIGRLLGSANLARGAEITMEANPGTTEYSDFRAYRDAGVNRLSIGAQSFDDRALQRLGRIHGRRETLTAFENARRGGFDNINIDLMWGLPAQDTMQAMADLDRAISLAPEHISWYQLTIEAKTEFARRTPLLPREDTLAEIEHLGVQRLAEAGYVRYEVSAYARSGFTCRHNVNYWRFGDYLGIGAGAHGKRSTSGRIDRSRKPAQPRLYLQDPSAITCEVIAHDALAVEFMLNALRLKDGVDIATFERHTGMPWSTVEPRWRQLSDRGLVTTDRCATTTLGWRYLDSVVAEFLPT